MRPLTAPGASCWFRGAKRLALLTFDPSCCKVWVLEAAGECPGRESMICSVHQLFPPRRVVELVDITHTPYLMASCHQLQAGELDVFCQNRTETSATSATRESPWEARSGRGEGDDFMSNFPPRPQSTSSHVATATTAEGTTIVPVLIKNRGPGLPGVSATPASIGGPRTVCLSRTRVAMAMAGVAAVLVTALAVALWAFSSTHACGVHAATS